MGKSVYSLVLSDEVVEEVDKMAYSIGTSRSALINSILAERFSCHTPEMRMNDIFSYLQSLMDNTGFRIQTQPSESMLSIRSALKYKYNPTIRYSLELEGGSGRTVGRLKVSFRTQSETLAAKLTSFLLIWTELEKKYILRFFKDGIAYEISGGKFIRTFVLPEEHENDTSEQIASAISRYINMFDEILKIYFSAPEDCAADAAAEKYNEYLKHGIVII